MVRSFSPSRCGTPTSVCFVKNDPTKALISYSSSEAFMVDVETGVAVISLASDTQSGMMLLSYLSCVSIILNLNFDLLSLKCISAF
jgi:hypothetical protein